MSRRAYWLLELAFLLLAAAGGRVAQPLMAAYDTGLRSKRQTCLNCHHDKQDQTRKRPYLRAVTCLAVGWSV